MMNNKIAYSQRGVTALGWMIILAMIAFFTLLALRVVPMYLEYSNVVSIMESIKDEAQESKKSKKDLKKMITRRLDMNDVTNATVEDVKFEEKSNKMTVTIEYEVRQPMVKQIGIVGSFNKSVEYTTPAR
ncbi:DUF4845 domain-containing protein [Candidatus Reidiella endopervernicosa]|nr:DUF4845 domain-containing protein [Solemya pervernicosa gill symbiont]QKQ27030.1 DUF4845 domain-containing protein [Candidatus Reidiella endopervernicosa]